MTKMDYGIYYYPKPSTTVLVPSLQETIPKQNLYNIPMDVISYQHQETSYVL